MENRRGEEIAARGDCGEESLKSAGLLILVTHFSIGGKNGLVGAVWERSKQALRIRGDKLCGKVHKKV